MNPGKPYTRRIDLLSPKRPWVPSKANSEAAMLVILFKHPIGPFTLQAVCPRLEVFVGGRATPGSPNFKFQVVHTTGGRPLIGHSVLTVNDSRITVAQTLVTER